MILRFYEYIFYEISSIMSVTNGTTPKMLG